MEFRGVSTRLKATPVLFAIRAYGARNMLSRAGSQPSDRPCSACMVDIKAGSSTKLFYPHPRKQDRVAATQLFFHPQGQVQNPRLRPKCRDYSRCPQTRLFGRRSGAKFRGSRGVLSDFARNLYLRNLYNSLK
jgi:hypothetical protein